MKDLVLVIDTSSAASGLALIEGSLIHAELKAESGRGFDTAAEVTALLAGRARNLRGVAVALGPGSFTGVRSGISFGVGLARGLEVSLYGLGTLELVAARAMLPVTAVSEAGRGRVYYLAPDGSRGLGAAVEVPGEWPLAGWLRPATAQLLREAGRTQLAEDGLISFGAAAAALLARAEPVSYGRVRPIYMSSFGGLD